MYVFLFQISFTHAGILYHFDSLIFTHFKGGQIVFKTEIFKS